MGSTSRGNSRGQIKNQNDASSRGTGVRRDDGKLFSRIENANRGSGGSSTRNRGGKPSNQSQSSNFRGSERRYQECPSGECSELTQGSRFPFEGYENTAGYPMNLNEENCPKYPFCYWNPYPN